MQGDGKGGELGRGRIVGSISIAKVAFMALLVCLWGVTANAAVTFNFFYIGTSGSGTVGGTSIDHKIGCELASAGELAQHVVVVLDQLLVDPRSELIGVVSREAETTRDPGDGSLDLVE